MLTLAIETSCDETSCAVLKDGREVLSNIISSQIEIHKEYGGVVPEIASRKHIESINPIVQESLDKAGVTFQDIDIVGVNELSDDVDAIVVTAVTYFDEIEEMLSEKVSCPIISLEDIIYEA